MVLRVGVEPTKLRLSTADVCQFRHLSLRSSGDLGIDGEGRLQGGPDLTGPVGVNHIPGLAFVLGFPPGRTVTVREFHRSNLGLLLWREGLLVLFQSLDLRRLREQ